MPQLVPGRNAAEQGRSRPRSPPHGLRIPPTSAFRAHDTRLETCGHDCRAGAPRTQSQRGRARISPGGTSNHSHTQTQRPDETPRWRVQRHDRTATMPGLPGDPRDPDADLLARPRPSPRTLASMRVFSTTHLMQAFATMRLCVQLGTMLFRTAHGWYVTVGLRRFSFMPAPNGCRGSAQSTTSSCTGSGRRAGRGSEGAAA